MKQTAIITGANSGIGFEAAMVVAKRAGWHVVLACRNREKALVAIDKIRHINPSASLEFRHLDLSSLASVRTFAEAISAADLPPIRALVCNAGGVNLRALQFTEDGFESVFQANHLGHFLLANLLAPHLATPARIVFVSASSHDPDANRVGKFIGPRYGPIRDIACAEGRAKKMSPMARYSTAKLLSLLAAYELDRRLHSFGLSTPARPITVNSWTPGAVPDTEGSKDMPALLKWLISQSWFVKFLGSIRLTPREAGEALAAHVLDAKYEGISGRYFEAFDERPSSKESRDLAKAREVWDASLVLAGDRERTDSNRGPVERPAAVATPSKALTHDS